jgi:hypothetical protein
MPQTKDRFNSLIACINDSDSEFISGEHYEVKSNGIRETTTLKELENFPMVIVGTPAGDWFVGIEGLLCLYLAYRNLTDHDIEKLIIALVKKPLIAARIAKQR